MTVRDSDTLKSYFDLTKVPTPSNYGDLVDTIFSQGSGGSGGAHDHDNRYVQLSIANTIFATHTFSPSVYAAPFSLGSNAQGQTVIGLKADQLNKSISVSGLGLSIDGGGSLIADRTITLASSSNPNNSASILASDANGYLSLLQLNTDILADRSGGNLTISPTGDIVFDPTGNELYPSSNYDLNLGRIDKKFLSLHAAELWVETLVALSTIATIGGRVLIGPTTVLTYNLLAADTTIYVKHNEMAVDDVPYMEAEGKLEFFLITGGPYGTGPFSYTVTRHYEDVANGISHDWLAGDAVFNTGTTDEGFIDQYSIRGIKGTHDGATTDYGPTIVGNVRNTLTYNDWSEHWAIGNLNGLYGYGVTTYGFAAGKYATGVASAFITADSVNGFRTRTRSAAGVNTTRIQMTSAGVLTINDGAGSPVFTFDASTGAEFTLPLTLAATGGIYQGSGTFASPATGLKIWNDGGIGRIAGYTTGDTNPQWYAGTDGKLYAGDGAAIMDLNGITVTAITDYAVNRAYKISNPAGIAGSLYGYYNALQTVSWIGLRAESQTGYSSRLTLSASAPAGKDTNVTMSVEGHASFIVSRASDGTYTSDIISPSIYVQGIMQFTHDQVSNLTYLRFQHANESGTNDGIIAAGKFGEGLNIVGVQTVAAAGRKVQVWGDVILQNSIQFIGTLKSAKNSTSYDVWAFHPLTTPLTSTSWDGDSKTTTDRAIIDLSAVFGVPAGVKAVLLRLEHTDDDIGSYCTVGPSSSYGACNVTVTQVANTAVTNTCPVPCDGNGDVYFYMYDSNDNIINNVKIEIWGYWI